MPDAFLWLIPIGMLVLLPFFFMATLAFDRLVRRLYEQYRDPWKEAGSPRGFFWKPAEAVPLVSDMGFFRAGFVWPFRPPPALAKDPAAQRDLRLLRIGLAIWNVGGLTLFGTLIFLYRRHP